MLATLALILTTAIAVHAAPHSESRDLTSFAPCEIALTNCLREEAGIRKCECNAGNAVRCSAIAIPLAQAGTEDLAFYRWERLRECPRDGNQQMCEKGRCVK
ncbi:hypothetical protein P171DRAFT_440407 [Karstenula rhodostoma CBS 690.94]|uniref:Uncharacterized protein n=1 Tax=Karstenula rhodostoma CBS 690.94 TaxID=1392251 RepID=A0A9P4PW35_9PLEO|nr:hypothetical protein P171DRAFT_440407 [Karstenula rhodostoma CBS 690.94]